MLFASNVNKPGQYCGAFLDHNTFPKKDYIHCVIYVVFLLYINN